MRSLGVPARLGLFYAAVFSSWGVQLPFWPLYLDSKGMSAAQIGVLVAATYLARLLTNPAAGWVVDRLGERRRPAMVLAGVAAVATSLFWPLEGFWPLLGLTVVAFGAISALLPIADNVTLLCVTRYRLDYGRIRLWGSIAFIVLAGLGGHVLAGSDPRFILLAAVATALFCLAVAALIPEPGRAGPREAAPKRSFPLLLASPQYRLFLLTTGLIQLSHVLYYGFSSLHWRAAGLSGGVIGGLWAEGVMVEVLLFAFGQRLLDRLGAARMMALGASGAIIRWSVLGLTTDPLLLIPAQALHSLTFAATYLGAMHFVRTAIPPRISAAGLGLYASVTMGLIPGLGMIFAGKLYQAAGGHGFFLMAGVAVLALAMALRLHRRWQGGLVVALPQTEAATARSH